MMPTAAIHCVMFAKDPAIDTHAAYDKKTKVFTVVMDGEYIVSNGDSIRLVHLKAGEKVAHPNWILNSACPGFGQLKQTIRGSHEPPKK